MSLPKRVSISRQLIGRKKLLEELLKLQDVHWQERLNGLNGLVAFSTSLSYEDQVVTHLIATQDLPFRIFTLDTGRLFEETHRLAQATREKYPTINIETFYPDAQAAQNLVKSQGINGFFESIQNRKNCCDVRKVEPLNRALEGVEIWISGLRRAHSTGRGDLPIAERDAGHGVIKFYPLIDVDDEELWDFVRAHSIPYNELHGKGYPSIGCAPCTRAIADGEDMRAGRWWWEQEDANQECGLHVVDGKLARINQ